MLLLAVYSARAALVGKPVDCVELVPQPVDVVPIRSAQAVHSVLATRFRRKDIVEIGTRNGDGMDCFARVAHSAVAIEVDATYCLKLRERARTLRQLGEGDRIVLRRRRGRLRFDRSSSRSDLSAAADALGDLGESLGDGGGS